MSVIAYLDEINALRDPELFADHIMADVDAHTSPAQLQQLSKQGPSKLKAHVVSMCASQWVSAGSVCSI